MNLSRWVRCPYAANPAVSRSCPHCCVESRHLVVWSHPVRHAVRLLPLQQQGAGLHTEDRDGVISSAFRYLGASPLPALSVLVSGSGMGTCRGEIVTGYVNTSMWHRILLQIQGPAVLLCLNR